MDNPALPAADSGPLFDLRGHVAVVTGGSQGLGLGMARGLARHGASVALWARRPEPLHEAAAALRGLASGGEVLAVPCDVSKEAEVVRALHDTLQWAGRLDSMFANAGVSKGKAFLESSLADYRYQNAINFEGTFLCFREAARQMIAQGEGGKLVATSSIAAVTGWPQLTSYSATKGAVSAAVRALAAELGPHRIQVNAISPGPFHTPMTSRMEGLEAHVLPRLPGPFVGTPEHIEGLAVFLASSASDYLTGTEVRIDGGLTTTVL